jgi:DNA-binding LytR/AlgR family response regulator
VSVEVGDRLRALVVEDEATARDYLVELLHGSGLARVVGAVASARAAREVLDDGRVALDVVFLDIRLSGGRNEGLEIARDLAGRAAPPMVVLATAFNAHAVEVYDLGVADYLLKPFTEQRVELCLQRLLARRSSPPAVAPGPARIVARRHKNLVFLDGDEVWAFEAADRLARVHSARGVFDIDLSLAAIEASIGRAFVRVHRNWLVNLAHIKELERGGGETRVWVGDGLVADGRGIYAPVARERAQQLRDLLLASATGLRRTT